MDLQPLLDGFVVVMQPGNLLFCLVGVLIGMLIGILPRSRPGRDDLDPAADHLFHRAGRSRDHARRYFLRRPVRWHHHLGAPQAARGVDHGGDGDRRLSDGAAGTGRVGALGIAAVGSFIGGTVSILGLSLLAPLVASFALDFGPPEYAVLALMGILLVSTLGSGSALKAVIAASFGLFLATVGLDPLTAEARFTGDIRPLDDGLDFVSIAMGLFGLSEILANLEERARGSQVMMPFSNASISAKDWAAARLAVLRGTLIGFVIGVLPGGGRRSRRCSPTPQRRSWPETAHASAAGRSRGWPAQRRRTTPRRRPPSSRSSPSESRPTPRWP